MWNPFYGAEIYSYVHPKYAKLVCKVGINGGLLVLATPSRTPGELPAGVDMKKGKIPKGTKFMNYDKQVVLQLNPADISLIRNFYNSKLAADKVEIIRTSGDKTIVRGMVFEWMPTKDERSKPSGVSCKVYQNKGDDKTFINIPMNGEIFSQFVDICIAYLTSYPMIKLFCTYTFGDYKKGSTTNKKEIHTGDGDFTEEEKESSSEDWS